MKYKLLLSMAVLLLFASCGMNRKREPSTGIVGKVTDSVSGEPMIGTTILVLGKKYGATTDLNGEYLIFAASPGVYTLKVSHVDYFTKRIDSVVVLQNQLTTLDIQLELDPNNDPLKLRGVPKASDS